MNRMTGFLVEDPENEYGDFFVVAGVFFSAGVTRESARRRKIVVRGTIDRRLPRPSDVSATATEVPGTTDVADTWHRWRPTRRPGGRR
jgi:hypothetical protein